MGPAQARQLSSQHGLSSHSWPKAGVGTPGISMPGSWEPGDRKCVLGVGVGVGFGSGDLEGAEKLGDKHQHSLA